MVNITKICWKKIVIKHVIIILDLILVFRIFPIFTLSFFLSLNLFQRRSLFPVLYFSETKQCGLKYENEKFCILLLLIFFSVMLTKNNLAPLTFYVVIYVKRYNKSILRVCPRVFCLAPCYLYLMRSKSRDVW